MSLDKNDANNKMQKGIDAFQRELNQIRAGRANPKILDTVEVNYYDTPTPLQQLASVSVPEARVLLITPYDANSLELIEQAIYAANIGLTPNSDGSSIRLTIPQLTEESRKELAKDVKTEAEKAKVSIRNVRRDLMDDVKGDKEMTEDAQHQAEDEIQKLTDDFTKQIDVIAEAKEKEIIEI